MKTAEDWAKAYENKFKQLDKEADDKIGEGVVSFVDIHEIIIREIQLDAMKEGMRRAAEQAKQTGLRYGDYDPSRDGRIVGNAAQEVILTAAEQLTEKDL